METSPQFSNIFIESLSLLEENPRLEYLRKIFSMPEDLQSLVFKSETGPYISGLLKTYGLSVNLTNKLALLIIDVLIGQKQIHQLSPALSSELQLPMDKAQKMAGEIEKDLFGPVRNELNAFLQSQKGGTTSPNKIPPTKPMANMRNVLDLKEITPKQKQPQLPPKPSSPSLPSAQKPSLQPKPPVPPKRPPGVPITPIHFS